MYLFVFFWGGVWYCLLFVVVPLDLLITYGGSYFFIDRGRGGSGCEKCLVVCYVYEYIVAGA